MEASERESNMVRRGLPLGPSFAKAMPSAVAKHTKPMMLRALKYSPSISQSSFGTVERATMNIVVKDTLINLIYCIPVL